jgi:hypothetical protein
MGQFEQDWLELGFRVTKAMHYQTRWARSYQELAAIEAEAEAAGKHEHYAPTAPRSNGGAIVAAPYVSTRRG